MKARSLFDRCTGPVGPLWVVAATLPVMASVWVAALAWSAQALALSQRGHTFGSSFGEPGHGAGQLELGGVYKAAVPPGVAVNEATGDVYVADRGNHRIDVFGPDGKFLAAWGWGVADGQEQYEVCTNACRAGLSGAGKGEFKEPGAIAVDNSLGGDQEVYVDVNESAKRPDVERFPPDGERPLGRLPIEEEGTIEGLAFDAHGTVWVYRGEEAEEGEVEGFSGGERPARLEDAFSAPVECPKPGFAVDAAGEAFYLDYELLDSELECPAVVEREHEEEGDGHAAGNEARPVLAAKVADGALVTGGLGRENTTAVAVDQSSTEDTPLGTAANGDVYVDNSTSIAAYTASGEMVQRFGGEQLKSGAGIAIDSRTGAVYVADVASDTVDVFEPEAADRPPSIDALWAQATGAGEVQLNARIDPRGTETHYFFQYGTQSCAQNPAACVDVPGPPGRLVGSGYGAQMVAQTLTGLQAGTTYDYRVLATNSRGEEAEGSDRFATVSTPPATAGVLADGRAWEMVSPAEKDGSAVQASANGGAVTYAADGPVVGEPQGNRAPEPTQVLSVRGRQGWSSQDLTTPHTRGEGLEIGEPWEYRYFSSDLAVSLLLPPFLEEPAENPPLAPGSSEKTVYARDDQPLGPEAAEVRVYAEAQANSGFLAPGYTPLVSAVNDTAEDPFGGKVNLLDATPDASHAVLEAEVPLLKGSAPGLYEWQAGGSLQLASVLPDHLPAGVPEGQLEPEVTLGDRDINVRGAVSEDGSRVFFYSEGLEPTGEFAVFHRLYMRDTATGETVQVNAAQGVSEPVGEESEVAFQGASNNGNRVFFTDSAPLTLESQQQPVIGAGENRADLYEFELTSRPGEPLAGKLTDLTADVEGGSADVLNVVSAISEEGNYVYFAANGKLTPNASVGDCTHGVEAPNPEAHCNLYVWHEGQIDLIATLSNEDAADWASTPNGSGGGIEWRPDLGDLTAGSSPDGEFFAFMSNQPLTGYDNQDAPVESVRDQEVYLYDAQTRLLVCASCNQNGERPAGIHDVASGNGGGPVVDRREDHKGQYLAGSIPGWVPISSQLALRQPRYLSNTGRLFFDSPADLVPAASNHVEDVYEYEPNGNGSCTSEPGCVSLISSGTAAQESAFMEASEDGAEAFFITAQPLVSADRDTNYDMYDARECTQASPCLKNQQTSEASCETPHACNPAIATPPDVVVPATSTPQGHPGVPDQQVLGTSTHASPPSKLKLLTTRQKLALGLEACHKDKNKDNRILCERRARHRYLPNHHAKARRAHKTSRWQARH
jgi:DNA-binding beta-propeller fold protein YncE